MSAIEKIRDWLKTYPRIDKVTELNVDYYSENPDKSSLAPLGIVEVSRTEDILGNIKVENQYNFTLYFVFPKGDDASATDNAEWLWEFQKWVQAQCVLKTFPSFGDDRRKETIKAQNGVNEYATKDGIGFYTVHLSINFTKIYEVN